MQAGEHVLGQVAHGILAHTFEHDVAHIVEHHGGEAPGGIGQHHAQRHGERLVPRFARHRIDCAGISEG